MRVLSRPFPFAATVAARSLLLLALVVGGGGLLCTTGCKGRKAAPAAIPVEGLAAIPATADAVVGVDIARVAQAPLVSRGAALLLASDAALSARWAQLKNACQLDLSAFRSLLLAVGNAPPPTSKNAASAPMVRAVLVVASGPVTEANVSSCVRQMVGAGGGSLTGRTAQGRTIYQVKDGARAVWFGFGTANTIVLGSNEAFVEQALGAGPKIESNPEFAARRAVLSAGQTELPPLWAIGNVAPQVGGGLVRATGGKITAGPKAFVLSADLANGLAFALRVFLASDADAKELKSFIDSQLGVLALAAQWRNLGPVLTKMKTAQDASQVAITAGWTTDDLNQLLSAIDTSGLKKETAPPLTNPVPAGSSAAADVSK